MQSDQTPIAHRYRKLPVEIEAARFGGVDDGSLIATWCGGSNERNPEQIQISTLEGEMTASLGDYVIRGVAGEFYPCKPTIFEATYERLLKTQAAPKAMQTMNFGEALAALRSGLRVARSGWNGAGMWLVLVPGSTITVSAGRPLGDAAPELVGSDVAYRPHIDMKTADDQIVPWVASQSDLLCDDWILIPSA